MNNWTIKQLNELDDITFAMCILSERQEKLNGYAPLAQKLTSAYRLLDKIRGGGPSIKGDCWEAIKRQISQEVEREYTMNDIMYRLDEKTINLQGLTSGEILSDDEIVSMIFYHLDKQEHSDDYWIGFDNAIEQGIEDVLERRKDGDE